MSKWDPQAVCGSFRIIETDFQELEDGRLIEMVEDQEDPGKSLFAVYKNGTIFGATTVEGKNHTFAPLQRQDQILKHVRFPRGVIPHESVKSLLDTIRSAIIHSVDVEDIHVILVAAFILSTWFVERLSVAPYLCIVGPPRSGKTTMLRLLNQLCRHALLTADVTSAALYDVYDKLTPTLIVDDTPTASDRRGFFRFLKAGSTRGPVVLRKGRSVDTFGPKVISCLEIPDDSALVSGCIVIPMIESSRRDPKELTDEFFTDATAAIQMSLLDYRLRNFRSLQIPKVDGDECLSSRTRDLYQALALPIGSQEEFCKILVGCFTLQQEFDREPLSPASATTLRSLYSFIHSHPDAAECANKDLLMVANLTPESLQLNAHEVGRALTSLGFRDRKRKNSGYIIFLSLATRQRIHRLAHNHEIDQEPPFSGEGFGAGCALRKEVAELRRSETGRWNHAWPEVNMVNFVNFEEGIPPLPTGGR